MVDIKKRSHRCVEGVVDITSNFKPQFIYTARSSTQSKAKLCNSRKIRPKMLHLLKSKILVSALAATLLGNVSQSASRDQLAITTIKFGPLLALVFTTPCFPIKGVVPQVCQCIVIPNVKLKEDDEELFKMNYISFVTNVGAVELRFCKRVVNQINPYSHLYPIHMKHFLSSKELLSFILWLLSLSGLVRLSDLIHNEASRRWFIMSIGKEEIWNKSQIMVITYSVVEYKCKGSETIHVQGTTSHEFATCMGIA
ncbi:hypothetical protein VNO77_18889 [Canavalia gladiata]|uniref:Exportin-2 central domain-containing protein n=1 Tax=Canavalia gladiata TaxID=3824 RepID=A0AAN9QI24_CANGL